jgi:hypothetical protein
MNIFSYWQVEDTIFGAILGAFLGTFIAALPTVHIILLVFFFILFPAILKKAESLSHLALLLAGLVSLLWIILFVFDLQSQTLIAWDKGIVMIIIFLGWLIAKSTSVLS